MKKLLCAGTALNRGFARPLAKVGCVGLLLTGCAVGPNHQRPAVNAPESFRNGPVAGTTNSLAELPWWELYRDATLSSLIRTALTNNYDLRIAIARAEAALPSTIANVPDNERQIVLKQNQLSVLLGRNPGAVAHTAKLDEQLLPPQAPAGLPSALLERRPDIRLAEQELRSANAQVGISLAEYFAPG